MWKAALGLVVVVALAAAGLFGTEYLMSRGTTGSAESDEGPAPTRVGVAQPQTRMVPDQVMAVGALSPVRAVDIAPSVAGRVTEVPVASGQTVAAGDLLVQLDDRAERATAADAQATYDAARQDLDRLSELEEEGNTAEAQLEQSRAAFERAEAALFAARADLEDRRIVAPFAGTLGLIDTEPGAFLDVNATVTRLSDLSVVELEAAIPERHYDRAAPGQEVEVTTPAYPDRTFSGTVTVRAPQIDPASQSFPIRAEIDNADRSLAGGMFADTRLVFGRYESLAVPDDAVISEGLATYVFVVRDGNARRVAVETGASIDSLTEIADGLTPEDRVVVAGWDQLSDGAPVEIDTDIAQGGLR